MTGARRALLVTLLWAGVVMALLLGLAEEGHFGGSLTAFLPRSGSTVQRALVQGLHRGEAARLLLLSIHGGSAHSRAHASRKLTQALRRHKQEFVLVANGGQATTRDFGHFLFRYRYLLAPRGLWSTASLHTDLERDLAIFESPAGLNAGSVLADPTGAFVKAAQSWQQTKGPAMVHGIWVSPDHKAALLLVETRQSGFAVGAQKRAVTLITTTFHKIAAGQGLALTLGGTGAITVAANQRVAQSARLLTMIDVLLVAAILLFVYRAWGPILVSLVPLVTGALVATSVTALAFPEVTVTTLGFGTMLIGVTMDYPTYVLLHSGRHESVAGAARRVSRALGLAMVAMVIGFTTMLASHLAGLVQLGVFASSGLIAAALAARFLLPLLLPSWLQGDFLPAWDLRAAHVTDALRRGAWAVPLLALAAAGVLWKDQGHVWDNHLSALSPAPRAMMAQTGRLAREFGVPGLSYLLVLVGPNDQAVLGQETALTPTLESLKKAGQIVGFDLASRYLPTVAQQQVREQALPSQGVLRKRLRKAAAGLPFRKQAFEPFLQAVARSRHLKPLRLANLPVAVGPKVAALLMTVHGKAVGFVHLTGVHDAQVVAAQIAKRGIKGSHFVTVKTEIGALLTTYRQALWRHSLVAGLLMVMVIGFGLRSFIGALRLLLPMSAAILVTCAVLVATGPGLTLLNVVALLLIVGLGMGYALFLGGHGLIEGRRALAPWVCAATTMTGFGVMAFSSVQLLRSVGLTVSIGAFLALLFTAAWSAPDPKTGSES